MLVLGIETSCDDCALALVRDGRSIVASVRYTQLAEHLPYQGVVPEIASRQHVRWIKPLFHRLLDQVGLTTADIDGVAATSRPGLSGSLLVGLGFGKALAYALQRPFVTVDHILAHLYAVRLEHALEYPYLGLLVSGGHTVICVVRDFDDVQVLGTTIDDACGEAFDKVAKYHSLGFPGGPAIDRHAQDGDPTAYRLPLSNLHKADHRYDVSYSGLKTAATAQLRQFWNGVAAHTPQNIAASFQKAAIDTVIRPLRAAIADTGLTRVVAAGGVAANSYLRRRLAELPGGVALSPSIELCTDNGAMVAGLGYQLLARGDRSPLNETVQSRVASFKHRYP